MWPGAGKPSSHIFNPILGGYNINIHQTSSNHAFLGWSYLQQNVWSKENNPMVVSRVNSLGKTTPGATESATWPHHVQLGWNHWDSKGGGSSHIIPVVGIWTTTWYLQHKPNLYLIHCQSQSFNYSSLSDSRLSEAYIVHDFSNIWQIFGQQKWPPGCQVPLGPGGCGVALGPLALWPGGCHGHHLRGHVLRRTLSVPWSCAQRSW